MRLDAYYTAQVFIHLPHPEEILHYPQQPRSLLHPASKARKTDLFETIAQGLESELAQSPRCAICAKATEIDGPYVPQSGGKFIGLSRCKKHGVMLVRIQFRPVQDHMQTMMVKTVKASRTNIAYIHTKQFQLRERLASEHGELGDLEMERMAPAYSPIDG